MTTQRPVSLRSRRRALRRRASLLQYVFMTVLMGLVGVATILALGARG